MLKTRTCRDEAKRLFMPRTTMACVTSIIATMRDIYHRSRRKEKIEMHTGYDADTGLPNRNLLMDRLNQLLSHDSRHNRAAAVICLGVDGLEGIACALGLDGGIEVLPNLVGELAQFLRHTDTMARLHRDELVIVLGGNLREADIDLAVSKVELILARPIRIPTGEITISASLGIACFPSDGLTAESLIQRAHFAMNRARESSDGFQYYCSYMTVKAMERLRFESVMI
jgi:diguanylate cyclase (GGDEF)-like protein